MRFALLTALLVGCTIAQADDPVATQIVNPVEVYGTVEADIVFPRRTIELYGSFTMQDGIVDLSGDCREVVGTTDDGYKIMDYNGCCPSGWHPLALAEYSVLICEED